jgi:hypothetical protein
MCTQNPIVAMTGKGLIMKMFPKVVALLAGLATAMLLSVGFAGTATARPRPPLIPRRRRSPEHRRVVPPSRAC